MSRCSCAAITALQGSAGCASQQAIKQTSLPSRQKQRSLRISTLHNTATQEKKTLYVQGRMLVACHQLATEVPHPSVHSSQTASIEIYHCYTTGIRNVLRCRIHTSTCCAISTHTSNQQQLDSAALRPSPSDTHACHSTASHCALPLLLSAGEVPLQQAQQQPQQRRPRWSCRAWKCCCCMPQAPAAL